jgi:hypothetical protein
MQINQNKVILSEAEKRERRAMERKLSEMEEELKVSSQIRCTILIMNLLLYAKANGRSTFIHLIEEYEETGHDCL